MIVADVAALQEIELQNVSRQLNELRKENDELKQQNEALMLANQKLTTQLETNDKEVQRLQREFDASEAGRVHAERQLAELNKFSGFGSVCILNFHINNLNKL